MIDEKGTPASEDDDTQESIVEEARERFALAERVNKSSRQQAISDTQFALGDSINNYQWPEPTRKARQFDSRVCLTINLTAKHCDNIINNIRKNRPSCRVMPVDNFSDKKTAEIISGLIRNIQSSSAADDAHDLAAEHMVYGGEGFWRVVTEYESEDSFDQVIKIKPVLNPQLVFIDPNAKAQDRSDAEWGFVFEDVSKEQFRREYPDIDASSWVNNDGGWVTPETIRIAEYFWCEYIPDALLLLDDGSTILGSEMYDNLKRKGDTLKNTDTGETIAIIKTRDTQRKQWKWCRLVGGSDDPIDLQDWSGSYLPIISVVGKEVNVNGEIIRKGLVRDLVDPARMVNYMYSEAIQSMALQNKIPYMAASEAIEGYESVWKSANLENRAYLPYNAYDEDGKPLPVPTRQAPVMMPAAQVQMLQLSTEEMRGVSGQQNANFGIRSEASSGIGIQRLNAQSEISTFHFPDNLSRALRYEAVVLIDLIQKNYDTKRIVRILGQDGTMQHATLDPEHEAPYSENQGMDDDIEKIFNPSLGKYDVVIDTGPSFQTQRQEAFASLTDLAGKSPNLMGVAGDIIMRAADFPMAQELADRLEKSLPPALQPQKQGKDQSAQVAQQAQQMQQQLQQMQSQLQEAQAKLQQAESGQAKTQAEISAKMQLAQFESQLAEQKSQRELAFRQQQAEMEADLKVQMLQIDKQFRLEQFGLEKKYSAEMQRNKDSESRIIIEREIQFKREQLQAEFESVQNDACAKVEAEKVAAKSREEIAELNAFVELQKAGIAVPSELENDVANDLAGDNENGVIVDGVTVISSGE